jgi:hypothetical protein
MMQPKYETCTLCVSNPSVSLTLGLYKFLAEQKTTRSKLVVELATRLCHGLIAIRKL